MKLYGSTRIEKLRHWALALALGLLAACGGSTTEVQTLGGETHFLQHCVDTCEGELACVNGVCSRTCDPEGDSSECTGLASATVLRCILPQFSSGDSAPGEVQPEAVANCDAGCTNDRDCSALGSEHQCESGFCRKAAIRSSDSSAMASMMVDEVDACPLLDDETGSLEVTVTIRNLTGAPIYFEPNTDCMDYAAQVTIVDEAGRSLLVNQPRPIDACQDIASEGPTFSSYDCFSVYPRRQDDGVYRVTSTATLIEMREISTRCLDDSRFPDTWPCMQSRAWPQGTLTLSARAYRAVDCTDPELCNCYMPDDDSVHEAEEIPCDLSVLEQAGWFEATTITTYAEIARTGLAEVVFESESDGEVR